MQQQTDVGIQPYTSARQHHHIEYTLFGLAKENLPKHKEQTTQVNNSFLSLQTILSTPQSNKFKKKKKKPFYRNHS